MKTAKTLSWLVAVAGLWELLAPFILGHSAATAAMWNAIIVGVVLIVLAVWAGLSKDMGTGRILNWINVVLGAWLVLSPFMFGYSAMAAALWNDIIIGIVVIVLAAWAATEMGKQIASHP